MKPLASLSLDLDNKWSYMKTHGDAGWDQFPSYLHILVPRVLDMLKQHGFTITFFVVGQDAAIEQYQPVLKSIADAGHEIGNHSFHHEPWLHLYSDEQIESEIAAAEEAIEQCTGYHPIGFRGPGFSCSPATLRVLAKRGYQYDCSTFPTYLGPLARLYYFMTSNLSKAELKQRKALFGTLSEGFRPLKAYRWDIQPKPMLEIPVTTMPIFKVPIHASYLLYLSMVSPMLAMTYFRSALLMCKLTGTAPSILLHPLDFLGADDEKDLSFFPAMGLPSSKKLDLMNRVFDALAGSYTVVSMKEHAAALAGERLRLREPIFRLGKPPETPTQAVTV